MLYTNSQSPKANVLASNLHNRYVGGKHNMFKIVSIREDGSHCELANEVPAFYALFHNNVCVGYYFTLEACKQASEDLITYGIAQENTISLDLSEAYDSCMHDERNHGICLDCGDEEDPGAAIDRAYDLARNGE